jgi:hypothetical protein
VLRGLCVVVVVVLCGVELSEEGVLVFGEIDIVGNVELG